MRNLVYAAVVGLAIFVVMFAVGLIWEQRQLARRHASITEPRDLSGLELLRKWFAAVAAGIVAFLLALAAYSA
jgi:hypothetical protein